MKNKPIIIAGIAVIIVAISILAVVSSHSGQQTSSPTTSSTTPAAPAADENTYADPSGRFSFNYPKQFSVSGPQSALTTEWRAGATSTGSLLASILVPRSYLPGTNFSDAKLTVGESTNKVELGASGCPASLAGYAPGSAVAETINGQTFSKIKTSDAAAGNRYDTTGYYTIRDGECWAIEYTIHYGNIQNYPAGAVKEFDETALSSQLDKIAQSFNFQIPE